MLKRLNEIIEVSSDNDKVSKLYDVILFITIILSIIPLTIKVDNIFTNTLEYVCVTFFIIDYLLRFITAKQRLNKGIFSFIIYPFTFIAIIDLLSILPSFKVLSSSFKLLKTFRLFRCLRIFKVFRFSKSVVLLCSVIDKQKQSLISIFSMAVLYVFLSALLMFNVEPDTFDNFFDAIYWAVTALTTVGYGDIYPITYLGKAVSMISSVLGIAIVALPAGVITAGFMEEIKNNKEE